MISSMLKDKRLCNVRNHRRTIQHTVISCPVENCLSRSESFKIVAVNSAGVVCANVYSFANLST